MVKLRKYQNDCIEEILSSFKVEPKSLTVLPTASGKTFLFCEIINRCIAIKPDIRILVLVNKISLAEQNRREAIKRGIRNTSYYCAGLGEKEIKSVTFASIQSIVNTPAFFHLIIFDETHNLTSLIKTYYDNCLELNPKLKFAGFTATPYDKDGYIYGPEKFYEKVTFTLPIGELIKMGFISDYRLFDSREKFDTKKLKTSRGDYTLKSLTAIAKDDSKARSQAKDIVAKTVNRNKVAVMCVDIAHCEKMKAELELLGQKCVLTHSKLPKREQRINKQKFEELDYKYLLSVNQVSEGYSYTAIDCVALIRPTKSPRLMVQMIGRGLRKHPGKEDCLILDYGDVLISCGTPRKPYIEEKGKPKKKADILSEYKSCPECLEYVLKEVKECECGYSFTRSFDKEGNLHKIALDDLSKVKPNKFKVLSMIVDFNYRAKSGRICTKITYRTNRGVKMKWLNRKSCIENFKLLSRNGRAKPLYIEIEKNKDNPKFPNVIEIWK